MNVRLPGARSAIDAGHGANSTERSQTRLQDSDAVVQHRLRVRDVVADGQGQGAEVRLDQQVGLRMRVVCDPLVDRPSYLLKSPAQISIST